MDILYLLVPLAGMLTGGVHSILVVQAQRDLATAQNTELRALLDYRKALVDFERSQQAPANRPTGVTVINANAGAVVVN